MNIVRQYISVNGSNKLQTTGRNIGRDSRILNGILDLSAGDYLELQYYQDSGGDITLSEIQLNTEVILEHKINRSLIIMGTIKTTNIEPIADNGTVTLGSSGDTFTVPSGVTVNMSNNTTGAVGTLQLLKH